MKIFIRRKVDNNNNNNNNNRTCHTAGYGRSRHRA